MKHVFDWQREPENSFLKWMLINLITGVPKDTVDELTEATEKWTKVKLTIQINGVDVPVEAFVDGVEHNMNYFAEKEAKAIVAAIPRLDKLRSDMEDADGALRTKLRELLAEAGIEMEEDDWRW